MSEVFRCPTCGRFVLASWGDCPGCKLDREKLEAVSLLLMDGGTEYVLSDGRRVTAKWSEGGQEVYEVTQRGLDYSRYAGLLGWWRVPSQELQRVLEGIGE